jgi:ABC-type Mn2+/Zn2+ transport system ATPase subunit
MADPAFILRARRLRAARGVVIARDVSLTASPGDVVAVEGPNGSGKTTLLAAAAGLLPAGSASVRPGSVGYSPERAGVLPRIALQRWLTGLARTSGLTRDESARRAGELMGRLGLAHAAQVPLQALSRGNAQRALVAQALIADPDLLVLDEPSGGLDGEGVARVVAEIRRAAERRAVVLVARHPTAPLPLPAGVTWQLRDGGVETAPREADSPVPAADGTPPAEAVMELETGDGVVRRVSQAGLPEVLRAALDAGLAIRRVQPASSPGAATAAAHDAAEHADVTADEVLPRAGAVRRLGWAAAHRARLLASSQWFLAPGLLFLVVLGAVYATDAGPPLQAAAVTAIALVPVMTWLSVLAHRVEGRELARAFAAHAGGRGRAHLATDLGLVPFALVLTAVAVLWPLVTQGQHPHPPALIAQMTELHLAAAVFGAGLGSLVALIERAGWRLIVTVAVFFGLVVIRDTPLTPLLRMSTHPVTASVAGPTAWLYVPGAVLVAAAAFLAAISLS